MSAHTEQEDVAMIDAVAAGDRAALGRLYDRYGAVLLALARQLLRGAPREAEDLVHDVFLEVWRKADDFDPGRGSVRAWLVLRLRSRALDRLKSAGHKRVRPMADEGFAELPAEVADDPALGPDRAVVRQALAALPDEQREALLLAYFEGLSSSEIAERLAMPLGTVKSRVAAALARLRTALGEP